MVQIGFPILDALTGLFLTMLEAAKGYFSIKVTEYNNKIRKLTCEEDKSTGKIDFTYEEEENDEEIL